MEVHIGNKELVKLYETGKSRKLKLPQNVIDKFFACIQKIDAATDIYDFWNDKALNFKHLQGENIYSMRLTIQFRLEMTIEWSNNSCTIGIVNITEISKHYE